MISDYRTDRADASDLELTGDIDIYRRAELTTALVGLEDAELAVVYVSKVTYFDLTLISGLVHLKKRMSARNPASIVRLVGASPHMRRVFDLTGLSPMFEFNSSLVSSRSSRNDSPSLSFAADF